jgi:hypothetical protein
LKPSKGCKVITIELTQDISGRRVEISDDEYGNPYPGDFSVTGATKITMEVSATINNKAYKVSAVPYYYFAQKTDSSGKTETKQFDCPKIGDEVCESPRDCSSGEYVNGRLVDFAQADLACSFQGTEIE